MVLIPVSCTTSHSKWYLAKNNQSNNQHNSCENQVLVFFTKCFRVRFVKVFPKVQSNCFPRDWSGDCIKVTWNTILVFILSFAFLNKQSYLFFKALLKYYFSLASSFPFHFPGKMNGPIIPSPLIFGIYFYIYIYICECVCVCTYIYIHTTVYNTLYCYDLLSLPLLYFELLKGNICVPFFLVSPVTSTVPVIQKTISKQSWT